MGSSSCREIIEKVSGHDEVGIRPAHAPHGFLAKRFNAAGTHGTAVAADAQLAKAALRLLVLEPVPGSLDAVLGGFDDDLLVILVKRSHFSNFLSCK
jgi:hypothetical protein